MTETELPKAVTQAIHLVRTLGAAMTAPNDDWDPQVLLYDGAGKLHIVNALYGSEEAKYTFWDKFVPKYILDHKIVEFAAILSAWTSTRAEGAPHVEPRLAPDRKECVGIAYVSSTTDSYYMAPMVRCEDRPPILGDFELLDGALQQITRRAQLALIFAAVYK